MSSRAASADARDERGRNGRARAVSGDEKRTLALLGLPTLALALVVTVVTTYLPVIARDIVGSSLVTGLIIGIEGLLALWLPLFVGAWSDRLRTRLGGRLPFLLVGAPVAIAGLVAIAFVSSTATIALAVFVFFVGYFLAYEPYRALYPDAVPNDVAGRAQSTQAVWRGAGTGIALAGGGLMLALGRATPFLVGAVVLGVAIAAFVAALARRGAPDEPRPDAPGVRGTLREVIMLVRDSKPLRAFLVANALWELALAALKTFIVLYVTQGLGFSRATGGLIIGGVALIVLLCSLGWGKVADSYGHVRAMRIAAPLFGLGLLVPLLTANHLAVALAIPFVAIGGGAVMALPYAMLMPLMPDRQHGVLTGYFSLTRGLGTWLGPLLAGLCITVLEGPFSETAGYQAMWLPCILAMLLSLIPLRTLARSTSSPSSPP